LGESAAVPYMQSRPLSMPAEGRPLSVLAIDDEVWVRELLRDTLSECGYDVTLLSTAEDALILLRDRQFDCILSDVNLPGMDGLAFSSLLKTVQPSVPVILITGMADVDLARTAIQQGASDFVTKPIDVRSLPIVVERNMERRRVEAQRAQEQDYHTRFRVIQALAAAIDAKQSYTAEHSRRVTAIAKAIGQNMELDDDDLAVLEMAAQVHDVGKIGVPDGILNKPGPLDDEEWEVMRAHSEQGADIVGQVPELQTVARIVRHHHERIDGKGYPDRLLGDDIPILSRVIAVADAFECMTGDRVYRSACPADEALRRLEEGCGTQFDSAVVRTFLRVQREGAVSW
jgi:putative two-component system response regulator